MINELTRPQSRNSGRNMLLGLSAVIFAAVGGGALAELFTVNTAKVEARFKQCATSVNKDAFDEVVYTTKSVGNRKVIIDDKKFNAVVLLDTVQEKAKLYGSEYDVSDASDLKNQQSVADGEPLDADPEPVRTARVALRDIRECEQTHRLG